MSDSWNTKWGSRRIRRNPPTLAEALVAAQGFTADGEAQVAIAAELMGVSTEEAKTEMRRLVAVSPRVVATFNAPARDKHGTRTVIVERKLSRRQQPPARPPLVATRSR